jgi:hypothetical protein
MKGVLGWLPTMAESSRPMKITYITLILLKLNNTFLISSLLASFFALLKEFLSIYYCQIHLF